MNSSVCMHIYIYCTATVKHGVTDKSTKIPYISIVPLYPHMSCHGGIIKTRESFLTTQHL